jgi:uncharacterized membrane protein YidH (DUF202 family)
VLDKDLAEGQGLNGIANCKLKIANRKLNWRVHSPILWPGAGTQLMEYLDRFVWHIFIASIAVTVICLTIVYFLANKRIARARRENRNWFQIALLTKIIMMSAFAATVAANVFVGESPGYHIRGNVEWGDWGFPLTCGRGTHVVWRLFVIDLETDGVILLSLLFTTEWIVRWYQRRHDNWVRG